LLVPVLRPDGPTLRGRTEVAGILWIESTKEEAFSREDIDLVAELATYVQNTMANRKNLEAVADAKRQAERAGLLAEVAHRICNPLQIAQSTLDLIQARLERGHKLGPMELKDSLTLTLHSLEDAIQAASLLRSERPEVVALTPLDLLSFVEEVAGAFLLKTEAQDCKVYTKPDPVIPLVSLNPALVRYTLNCLLDNALEAIQRRRVTNGKPDKGVIEIGLHASPESGKSVLLSVRDNGCGIAEQDLPRLFDRYFTTKTEDHPSGKHGLGLWEVRRFVEAVGGIVEALPLPKGGAELRLLFPAAEAGESSREIIL
jgi:signal transduction histidine kinase